jgi:hypothetical protein
MKTRTLNRPAIAALAALAFAGAAPAFAQHGGGGFHGGGGGSHGGGAFHGSGGFRGGGNLHAGVGGFRGGYRGGYFGGLHNGRGYGWGGRGYYGGAGWLGYGLLFSALPLAYSTYYWDGVPYYYADDNYYQWDSSANEYETVQPPSEVVNEAAAVAQAQPAQAELFAYPKNGQTATQQAKDRTDCQQWATAQTGAEAANLANHLKAEEACLTGKGYSVR